MFIRYFARTDETELGRQAAAYCDQLVSTGAPVRLVSAMVAELQLDGRGRHHTLWDRHRQLLTTPMMGRFVNVVCGLPVDWSRFWTAGVTNVLLVADSNIDVSEPASSLAEWSRMYDFVHAGSPDAAAAFERLVGVPASGMPNNPPWVPL